MEFIAVKKIGGRKERCKLQIGYYRTDVGAYRVLLERVAFAQPVKYFLTFLRSD
jgi:hypothetical protein